MIVQISAGQGPSECQLAVAKLFAALKREYEDLEVISETKGYEKGCLDSIRFRTAQDLSSLEGTVLWICKSPFRPNHKRKNWYVDVSIIPEQGEISSEKEYRIEKFHCGGKDLDDNILTDSAAKNMTVNSLFQYYMATKEWADSTSGNYVKMWNNHVKDDLGNMKVVQLLPSHVKAFYAKMSRAGYSYSTIKLIHTLLYPALEMAVDDDIIRKNPAKRALSGDYGRPPAEKDILTLEQQERLFSLICESNVYNVYAPMFTVLLETGLRCGELIGLTWGDVDMANRELTVDHQLIYKDWGEGYSFRASKPKTKAGVRTIPFTENVYRAFTEQRKINFMLGRRSTEEIDGYSDFIFLAKTGRPLMPSAVNNVIYNVADKYNKEEVVKAKKEHRKADLLPRISAHNLRHTACTNMAKQGMNVKVLQYIMGHAHSDVTMDVYNHIANKQDIREEVERYARVAGN